MKSKTVLNQASMHEVEILYKRPVLDQMPRIENSETANSIVHQAIDGISLDYKEHFWCFFLTNANTVLGYSEIGNGTAAGVAVNVSEVFATALKTSSSGIIIVHNHPSGMLKPSTSDRDLTNKIRVLGELHGIKLIDHLIITSEKRYYSFADDGELSSNKISF